jgi:CheY-like chemotaxis protein
LTSQDQRKILMADDDEEDRLLAKEAFEATGTEAALSFVEDGMELMEYLLNHSGPNSNALPDIILLDLNMPRKNGREALLEIRSEPTLRHIPIVILTTSEEESDIALSIKAEADGFITKPAVFDEWIEIMKSVSKCWPAS